MDLSLFFAGTAGSVPTARRGPARDADAPRRRPLLFDCGEGTQRQLAALGRARRHRRDVFLTHFHADHWLGLPGMLKTFELRDRDAPLAVYGPPGTADADGRDARRLRPPALRRSASSSSSRARSVRATATRSPPFAVRHRAPRLRLRARRGRRARAASTPSSPSGSASPSARTSAACSAARPSTACGPSRSSGPSAPGRKIVLSGDTGPVRQRCAPRATAPTCSCTRRRSPRRSASARAQTGHTTARQAAEIAREAEVRLLALTHLSTRYAGARDPRRGARGLRAHGRPARLRHDRDPVPREGRADARSAGDRRARRATRLRRVRTRPRPRRALASGAGDVTAPRRALLRCATNRFL